MKTLLLPLLCLPTLQAAPSDSTQTKPLFTNDYLQSAYDHGVECHDSIRANLGKDDHASLNSLRREIDKRSQAATQQLEITIPWLSELVYQATTRYAPLHHDDSWVANSIASADIAATLLQRGYDFCWLECASGFRLWNPDYCHRDLGYLERGIIMEKGVLHVLSRRVSFPLGDRDPEEIRASHLHQHMGGSIKIILQRLKPASLNDARTWRDVIRLASESHSAWYDKRSIHITSHPLSEDDYKQLLSTVRTLKVTPKKRYSAEQALLAEKIYSQQVLDFVDEIWTYSLYGFDSKIEGVSFRSNAGHDAFHLTPYYLHDRFFASIIGELGSSLDSSSPLPAPSPSCASAHPINP